MKEVRFSVQVKVKDVFLFLLQHSYRGITMIANTLVTVAAVYLFVTSFENGSPIKLFALAFLALLFPVIQPLMLYNRARKQVAKNPAFAKPIDYALSDEGITMSQGEESQSFAWGDVFQIKELGKVMFVYTGRVYACIWPKREFASCETEVMEMLRTHLSAKVAGKSVR